MIGVTLVVLALAASESESFPANPVEEVFSRTTRESTPECEPGHGGAVVAGKLTIKVGQTICVSLTAKGDAIEHMAVVPTSEDRQTLVLKFWQEQGTKDTYLSISNPLDTPLRYQADMLRQGSSEFVYTSSCSVSPGIKSIEHWPFVISELVLSDFVLLPGVTAIECK